MATLTLAHVSNPLEYGVIITDDDGHIRQFLEKPSWSEVFSDTINTGIYVLDPRYSAIFRRTSRSTSARTSSRTCWRRATRSSATSPTATGATSATSPPTCRPTPTSCKARSTLPMPGKDIGGRVFVEEGVEIAEDAQIFGPVFLGNECKIKDGVIVHGPSVVGPYTIIDNRAQVDRSVIWNNSYIGERAELRGALVGTSNSIKSKAVMFEGAVIGDHSVINEGAIIQPGVKIWPNKEIETGAVVTTSIIWGSRGRRSIFGRYGVTGLVNVDLTPDFAARLGAAYGAVLPKGSVVCVNRDSHRTPRMIKRAIISGLPSAGVNVWDLEAVPLPVARFYVRTTDAVGGVHIRLSPFDPRTVDIKFFDAKGPGHQQEHRAQDREPLLPRGLPPRLPRRYRQHRVCAERHRALPQRIPASTSISNMMRKQQFRLVVDYAQGASVDVMADIFNEIGADVIALNATRDPNRYSRTPKSSSATCKCWPRSPERSRPTSACASTPPASASTWLTSAASNWTAGDCSRR